MKQADKERLHAATKAALQSLRAEKLLTFRKPADGSRAEWKPTEMGLAVFESSLPTDQGTALYTALQKLHANQVVLEDQAQLIYLVIQASMSFLCMLSSSRSRAQYICSACKLVICSIAQGAVKIQYALTSNHQRSSISAR